MSDKTLQDEKHFAGSARDLPSARAAATKLAVDDPLR